MKEIRVVDFFCGAGGFSEGLSQAGFKVIKGIDNWGPAIKTHNVNHGLSDEPLSVLEFEDINKIFELPDSEVIVGSPPCVSFSLSNRGGNADKSLGIRLIEAYLRVVAVKKHQPHSVLKAWLMENVPNSRNFVKEKYTFRDLNLADWATMIDVDPDGVALKVKNNGDILKASDYGAAQARRRFVCGEVVESGLFPAPEKHTKEVTVRHIRSKLPAPLAEQEKDILVSDPNYVHLQVRAGSITDHHYDTGVYEIDWRRAKALKLNHPYMGRMSFPENEDKPSRTIMATRSASTREAILYKSEVIRKGNGEYRSPTIREAASMMGFPVSYVFFGNESTKWRQIGNAVCPQMAYALGNKIRIMTGLSPVPMPRLKVSPADDSIMFLDDYKEKSFDKPPRKNSKSLFRSHPVKSGNMTVALTNKNPVSGTESWSVVTFMGTGKRYRAVEVSDRHRAAAKDVLVKNHPGFLRAIDRDKSISRVPQDKLDALNGDYHYNDEVGEHPLSLVNTISNHIAQSLRDKEDSIVKTEGTALADFKETLPLSQIMAMYATSGIVKQDDSSEKSLSASEAESFGFAEAA